MADNAILAAWKAPFHRGRPEAFDLHGRAVSPACGDEIDLYLVVGDGMIEDAYFNGNGCVICLGMASLLTEHLIGQSVMVAREMTEEAALALAGMEIDRRRRGCALVAFKAFGDC
jgi:nitrogen fixation NifU-like protein